MSKLEHILYRAQFENLKDLALYFQDTILIPRFFYLFIWLTKGFFFSFSFNQGESYQSSESLQMNKTQVSLPLKSKKQLKNITKKNK